MIHLDLFSGIGGFAYAIDQIWDGVEHIFCEIDPFCQQVLKKHWEGAKIYGDIRQLAADTDTKGRQSRLQSENFIQGNCKIDILTGGFPCQPFSQAGKRRGTEDNRFLWPEMLRVIRDFKPAWVIAENVRGLLTIEQGVVFEQVCLDLEACGYEVQPFIIPAVAVNAPHRRDRVWFVAYSKSVGERGCIGEECGIQERKFQPEERKGSEVRSEGERCNSHAPNTEEPGLERYAGMQEREFPFSWQSNWIEVATELCGVDDGLPVELDGFKLSKAGHRVERLKALGNAIVPQVAIEIFKAIKVTNDTGR